MYSLSVEQKVGVAMKEVCSSSRHIRGTGVFRQGYKVHLLACHVITQADKVEIRRNKDQRLLHQLSTALWKHLHVHIYTRSSYVVTLGVLSQKPRLHWAFNPD